MAQDCPIYVAPKKIERMERSCVIFFVQLFAKMFEKYRLHVVTLPSRFLLRFPLRVVRLFKIVIHRRISRWLGHQISGEI